MVWSSDHLYRNIIRTNVRKRSNYRMDLQKSLKYLSGSVETHICQILTNTILLNQFDNLPV